MRILHVIDRFHLGGSEEHATILAVGLAQRGHHCVVVAVRRPEANDQVGTGQKLRLKDAGIQFSEIGGPNVGLNLFYTPLRLLALIRRFRPDLVHVNTDIPDLMVSIALRLRKFNVVRTIHNTSLWETRPRLGRFSEAGYENDLIISVSQDALSAYRDLRQRFGLTPSAHQTVVSGSVANISEEDTYCREKLADRFGANTEKVLLCFAGRLVEQKGFDILIDAVSGLESEFREKVEIHVFTAGHGLKDYQDRVFAQNLPFHFHQLIAHIARYFSAFDGILMPSRWEGYGRVAAEGFLAGTPVLAADAPGLREIFPPGWPLKFPINNPAALRGALRDLLNDYHDLDELGRAAKEWAQSAFSVDREVDEYDVACAEYLEILQN